MILLFHQRNNKFYTIILYNQIFQSSILIKSFKSSQTFKFFKVLENLRMQNFKKLERLERLAKMIRASDRSV